MNRPLDSLPYCGGDLLRGRRLDDIDVSPGGKSRLDLAWIARVSEDDHLELRDAFAGDAKTFVSADGLVKNVACGQQQIWPLFLDPAKNGRPRNLLADDFDAEAREEPFDRLAPERMFVCDRRGEKRLRDRVTVNCHWSGLMAQPVRPPPTMRAGSAHANPSNEGLAGPTTSKSAGQRLANRLEACRKAAPTSRRTEEKGPLASDRHMCDPTRPICKGRAQSAKPRNARPSPCF